MPPIAPIAPVNPLSMVGLMLTLASLVGSFFYIQLSQWLRDVQALSTKIELSELGNAEEVKKAIRECRVEQARLSSWHSFVVNLAVIGFVVFILRIGFHMIDMAATDPLHDLTRRAFVVFQWIFLVLSIGLFALGIYRSIANWRKLAALPGG